MWTRDDWKALFEFFLKAVVIWVFLTWAERKRRKP